MRLYFVWLIAYLFLLGYGPIFTARSERMYKQFLQQPAISTAYQLNENSTITQRLEMAHCFLSNKEYMVAVRHHIDFFTAIENILKSKVLTYAIAFAGGAVNGGILYQNARADLLTWRAIFEGATFVNGWLQ